MPDSKEHWVKQTLRTRAGGSRTAFMCALIVAALPLAFYAVEIRETLQPTNTSGMITAGNSQTLALLESVPNPDAPSLALGGGDIAIVDESALLAESGPAGTLADVEGSKSDRISVYVVREGDTLSQIASMFEVSVNTIRWANDISSRESIQPGQRLVILPISGVQHVVEDGDTLAKIAKEYDGDPEEIANYNALDSGAALTVGTTIVVPNGEVAAPAPVAAPTYVPPTPSGTVTPSYAGYYMRPVAGGVKSQGIHGYNGVDLAKYYGAEIFAAAAGEVIISKSGGWNGGYGNYIVIRHDNGSQTLYAHNSQNIVSVGQRVVQGQVIGYVGSTGRSTGSHVHFEIRNAGIVNPF